MAITKRHKEQRNRNFAVAGVLLALAALFFAFTIARMTGEW